MEKKIAMCYSYAQGDEKNKCMLTESHLYIVKNGKTESFELLNVNHVAVKHKRILAPLVIGGTIASLSLLSIVKNMMNPWFVITSCMVGLFLFYYGWMGTDTVSVTTGVKEYNYFMRKVSKNLRAFLEFTNGYLPANNYQGTNHYFSFLMEKQDWERSLGKSVPVPFDKGQVRLYMSQQISQLKNKKFNLMLVTFDPTKVKGEIKYEHGEKGNSLVPYFYQSIVPEAVVKAEFLPLMHNKEVKS